MTDRAPELAAAAAAALAGCAIAVLLAGSARSGAQAAGAEGFQRSVGGLGTGAATDLASCGASFDRSAGVACDRSFDPVPGGRASCVLHSGPSLRR